MLRSRIFRRLPFKPMPNDKVPALMRGYHPIYAESDDTLLLTIDDTYAHGSMRDCAVCTHTAAQLCGDAGLPGVNAEVVINVNVLLGAGLH
jgi:hypothetical protein